MIADIVKWVLGWAALVAAMEICGCTSAQTAAAARVTCAVVARAHEACSAAGLGPSEPCPVDVDLEP